MKTGDGITLHENLCEDCRRIKPCLEGVRQVGSSKPTTFHRCIECDNELVRRYEASLKH